MASLDDDEDCIVVTGVGVVVVVMMDEGNDDEGIGRVGSSDDDERIIFVDNSDAGNTDVCVDDCGVNVQLRSGSGGLCVLFPTNGSLFSGDGFDVGVGIGVGGGVGAGGVGDRSGKVIKLGAS